MTTDLATTTPIRASKSAVILGWLLGIAPAAMLIMSAVMKLLQPRVVVEGFASMGFPDGLAVPIGVLELGITLLYLIPRSAVLGAILLTGYLGGAIVTHVRMSESFFIPFLLGVLLWAGLYLRYPNIRTLIPFNRQS